MTEAERAMVLRWLSGFPREAADGGEHPAWILVRFIEGQK